MYVIPYVSITNRGLPSVRKLSEEIQNAAVIVARSIMFSIFINGLLRFGMILSLLFIFTDVDAALKSPTGYPFMEIFLQVTRSIIGAAIMVSIILVMQIFANVGILTTCSRMFWSFARDRGLPGWRTLALVRKQLLHLPIFDQSILFR